jgi:hypothetical protein
VSGPLQVRNPVSLFADNNGVILQLQSVSTGVGALTATGSLVFGIGTQSNNGLGSATVLPLDTYYPDNAWLGITTVFNGVSYPNPSWTTYTGYGSFFDSGSNGIFFLDQATLKTSYPAIVDCATSGLSDWYCPGSTQSLTAVNKASNGTQTPSFPFSVTSANTLFTANPTYTAFSDLAGPNTPGTSSSNEIPDGYFDWGLPFFYGKSVYTAIWGVTPPSGVPAGPFWAY